MTLLIQLTENDKRIIIAVLLIVILVFVIIGLIGMLITRIMQYQGKKLDTIVADVLITRVITSKKEFFPYARKKNMNKFVKEARIPFLIMLIGALVLIIRNVVLNDWSYCPFVDQEKGFASLIWIWDFKDPTIFADIFGLKVLAKWPPLIHEPTFQIEAWASYIFVPFVTFGLLWYLVTIQAYIARKIRMHRLGKTVFEKNLDSFNQNLQHTNSFSPNQNGGDISNQPPLQ